MSKAETLLREFCFLIRQPLFEISVFMAKPLFVKSMFTDKTVFINSVGLRVSQKIQCLPIFDNL